MAANVRTGGKGTVRRKRKAVHKSPPTDDKKVQSTLKKLGLSPIPNCEEAHLFREDGKVLVFSNPKLSGSIGANTFALSGTPVLKDVGELVSPELLSQLGGTQIQQLQELMARLQAEGSLGSGGAAASDGAAAAGSAAAAENDEGVPDLSEATFDDAEKPAVQAD
uniref:Nascent polypeptide-associated complex subunit beta n=1 Tax=Erythrolobus australicus TaxID=1077150 RepID=A0A7S1TLQ5_9RHOD